MQTAEIQCKRPKSRSNGRKGVQLPSNCEKQVQNQRRNQTIFRRLKEMTGQLGKQSRQIAVNEKTVGEKGGKRQRFCRKLCDQLFSPRKKQKQGRQIHD